MGQCSLPGCKTMLVCCKPDGTETPFGQVESWTHNSSREESEGSYIAGTCVDPQPDPNVTDVSSYLLWTDGQYYETCESSSSCTDEISINGRYCIEPGNSAAESQKCLKCNSLITLKAYLINDDNTATLLWEGTGTVENKNRSFTGGTEATTFDSSISFDAGALSIPAASPYC